VINEKPALARRLIGAIEHRFINIPLDPIATYRKDGMQVLNQKLERQSVDNLRILVKQCRIPCKKLGRRRKNEIIRVISEYAANTDIRRGSDCEPAHAST
jgi:hypothetical protein